MPGELKMVVGSLLLRKITRERRIKRDMLKRKENCAASSSIKLEIESILCIIFVAIKST